MRAYISTMLEDNLSNSLSPQIPCDLSVSGGLKECSTLLDAIDSMRTINSRKEALMISKFVAGGTDNGGLGGSLATTTLIIHCY